MLKYKDKIANLSDAQKIRILSSIGNISGSDMANIGIPGLRSGNMKDYGRSRFPHVTSLAHSWNAALWTQVAAAKVQKMAESGVNFAIAPGAKIKLSPYRKETTEDPYLASVISGAYMKAAKEANMTVGASGYYLTESDVEWLDQEPNLRILNEYVVRPYERASRMVSGSGVVTDLRVPSEAYANTSAYLQSMIFDQTEFLICENANDFNTVHLVSHGVICLNGSANALSAALLRYRKLKKLLEQGKDITFLKIEQEMESGTAISDETLDIAVDRTLDFLFQLQEKTTHVEFSDAQEERLALRATLESTVLLKNKNGILPISKNKSIVIVDGFSSFKENIAEQCRLELEPYGYRCAVEKLGGSPDEDIRKRFKRINQACYNADVTLLLLGSGYEAERKIHKTQKLTLPPEQLDLVDQVAMNAKNVVAVIFSEHGTDVEFTRLFDGVLFAPTPVECTPKALSKILSGRYNPTGRLAYTLYMGSDTSLRKGEFYLHNMGMKAGPFVGYRYYDKAKLRVGYPFGYGKSYTEFAYSNLSIKGNTVSFTVQNCGRMAGGEVAQVYAGLKESSVLRPEKELCGFVKIHLQPNERKQVSITIDFPTVFDQEKFVLEAGNYNVYVGTSVFDIRLSASIQAGDATLAKTEEKLSDYLQSYSNILNDHYTLEANYSVMKKGFTNIIAGAVALLLAIVLAIFNISTYQFSLPLGVISGILAFGALVLFVLEVIERYRLYEENRKKTQEENINHFADAEQIPMVSAQKMFEDQFDTVEEEPIRVNEVLQTMNLEVDYSQYIDEQFKLKDAVAEFIRFAADRGCKFERGVVENVFASLAVSKLLILNGLSAEEYNSFVLLLSEYFGCMACIDNSFIQNNRDDENTNVFFARDPEGYHVKKNIFKALHNAQDLLDKVHISALDEMTADTINDWLAPIMRYLRSPKRKNEIIIPDERDKKWGFNIGNNLWILVRLSDTQAVDMLPIDIVKCASVVSISLENVQASEDPIASHGFSSYQMEYMLWQISGKYEVSEDIWKKIDRLEKYAQNRTSYTIGNKLWLDLEKQMEALLACDMERSEATDAAVAMRILPSITVALKGLLEEEDQTPLQVAEFVFGVDNVQFIKAYIDHLVVKEIAPIAEEAAEVEETTEETSTEEVAEVEETTEEAPAEEVTEVEETTEEAPAEEVTEVEETTEEASTEEVAEVEETTEEAPAEEVTEVEETTEEASTEEVVEVEETTEEAPAEEVTEVEETTEEESIEQSSETEEKEKA